MPYPLPSDSEFVNIQVDASKPNCKMSSVKVVDSTQSTCSSTVARSHIRASINTDNKVIFEVETDQVRAQEYYCLQFTDSDTNPNLHYSNPFSSEILGCADKVTVSDPNLQGPFLYTHKNDQSAVSGTMEYVPGDNYAFNDISSTVGQPLEECKQACLDNPQCIVIAYLLENSQCWLKHTIGNTVWQWAPTVGLTYIKKIQAQVD